MGEKDKDFNNTELSEDSTQYGEFISSFFSWIPRTEQKERAERLENLGKDKKSK